MVQSKKLLIVVGILAVSLLPRFLLTGVRTVVSKLPVTSLPERVGEWEAVEVLVCPRCHDELREAAWQRRALRNPKPRLVYMRDALEDNSCPVHHRPLNSTKDVPVRFVVKKVLPRGTTFLRRWYRGPADGDAFTRDVLVTVVISGADKRSIHRPERCLPAQGWHVVSRGTWAVPLAAGTRRNLDVTRLVVRSVQRKKQGEQIVFYWFMSSERLTGSNLRRLLWGWWDRVVRGVNTPWAYALLISPAKGSLGETSREMAEFSSHLLPLIWQGNGRLTEAISGGQAAAPQHKQAEAVTHPPNKKKMEKNP